MNLDDAVQALIPVAEVSEARRELVRELSLSRGDEACVWVELVCLHVLAVHFAIVRVFAEDPPRLARFIEAYHRHWTTYSAAGEATASSPYLRPPSTAPPQAARPSREERQPGMDLPRGIGGVGWTAIPIGRWRRFHDPISPKPFAALMLMPAGGYSFKNQPAASGCRAEVIAGQREQD